MSEVTATDAARRFADLLDSVEATTLRSQPSPPPSSGSALAWRPGDGERNVNGSSMT
jgi:hypothetical protein